MDCISQNPLAFKRFHTFMNTRLGNRQQAFWEVSEVIDQAEKLTLTPKEEIKVTEKQTMLSSGKKQLPNHYYHDHTNELVSAIKSNHTYQLRGLLNQIRKEGRLAVYTKIYCKALKNKSYSESSGLLYQALTFCSHAAVEKNIADHSLQKQLLFLLVQYSYAIDTYPKIKELTEKIFNQPASDRTIIAELHYIHKHVVKQIRLKDAETIHLLIWHTIQCRSPFNPILQQGFQINQHNPRVRNMLNHTLKDGEATVNHLRFLIKESFISIKIRPQQCVADWEESIMTLPRLKSYAPNKISTNAVDVLELCVYLTTLFNTDLTIFRSSYKPCAQQLAKAIALNQPLLIFTEDDTHDIGFILYRPDCFTFSDKNFQTTQNLIYTPNAVNHQQYEILLEIIGKEQSVCLNSFTKFNDSPESSGWWSALMSIIILVTNQHDIDFIIPTDTPVALIQALFPDSLQLQKNVQNDLSSSKIKQGHVL